MIPRLFFFALALLLLPFSHASERPNIILVMVDDMGFSDLGYHGGEIETPNLDALARGGVRFSQFYNAGRCCPTRATLMTGLHPHETGIGWMTSEPDRERGQDAPTAYQGHLNEQCVTLAEALKSAGYGTYMTGKWHLGQKEMDDRPLQRGFDRYYGCLSGATRFFQPTGSRGMTSGNDPDEHPKSTTDRPFYTTDAFTDHAIGFLRQHAKEKQGDPFFLYLAYTAPHWPLQAHEEDIAKYRGKYKAGWDKLREERYRRQVELGLIDASWPLSPKTEGIPDWDSLDEAKRDEMDLKMAVFAAMVDRVDQNIGKLVASLKESGTYENTLILFLSDNGACQEGGMFGRGEFHDVAKRNEEHDNSYGEAWANAGSTPFRLYKHYLHEGGAATPFFLHWPAKIAPREGWYGEAAQLIDVMPTLLDVAGASYPTERKGVKTVPLDGVSLRPAFTGDPLKRGEPIFAEHETNASVRDGNWKLVGESVAMPDGTQVRQWELYDLSKDRTELNNLAAAHPEKVKELAAKWETWAARVGVYPRAEGQPPVKNAGAPAAVAEPDPPQVEGRAFSATVTLRHPNPKGVALAHGGNQFGYALWFRDGRPVFSVRKAGKLTELTAPDPVNGKVSVTGRLEADSMTLWVNDTEVARTASPGLLEKQPVKGLYLGQDIPDAVGSYQTPHKLNAKLMSHSVSVIVPKVAMRTEWGEKVTPENVWQEYPRPALRRENWTNLNGLWDYAVTPKTDSAPPLETWDGKILVPFAIEAPLSGVERRFTPEDALWYRRTFEAKKPEGKHLLLNFEAVDYQCTVWVNDVEVGSNTGGNLPFSFDITDAVKEGANTLLVRVTDATDTAYQLHGKQVLNPRGIWYTPVSGIWQTVWMEEVPMAHLKAVHPRPRLDGTVELVCSLGGPDLSLPTRVVVSLGGKTVFEEKGNALPASLRIENPQPWSPESPTLYDLRVEYGEDVIESYFAFRETTVAKDADGHLRLHLNGKPIFHWGTLDQGWWPDGLLTPPSDAAMLSDIEFLKAAGFNTIRKHIKVEPRRYYYHCDRLGMMMWQDQVSSGGRKRGGENSSPEWTRLQPEATDAVWPDEAHAQYRRELEAMVDVLGFHPCIVQWVPFNEAWGQHRTLEVGEWLTGHDPTRQVNVASGGNWFPAGHIVDEHRYPHPGFPFELGEGGRFDGFVKVVGEFGGHGFPVEGHLWNPATNNWGYGGLPKDKTEWLERYRESIRILTDLKKQGIAAGIYTQTTDVEGEINGLITYDRKVRKLEPAVLREIAKPLFE
ncbi:MAG: sulfatase-like hydrolase/transferase [Verrucomicrobiales bacterium]|nr:sulfatase-like hydrolase/transferase [Verrucomicrobiales bacterium]